MDIKQLSNKELMKLGTQEAAEQLQIRKDRVEAGMKVIKEMKGAR